jgi:hypothetical protein
MANAFRRSRQNHGSMKIVFFCLLISFTYSGIAAGAKDLFGSVSGIIVDETTLSPLPAVNVMLENSTIGTAADLEGRFTFEKLPVGMVNIRFQIIGYKTRIVSNVAVNSNRTTHLKVELESTALETEDVVVTAGYFHEAKDAVVSNRSMDFEEVRSDPGSAEDVQRVVQALPAVVSGADQDNEIIVRGGMPGENLFLMDGIEIPNPNHFGYQGAGGGPINMLNTYFVRRIDFYAGAFPAKYGDKASSVMDISLRDGNRERFEGHFYLGMSGAGAMAEGPVGKGKGSWILSGRKSFLDLIISSTGLTAVPHYYNLQGKASYDLSANNRLFINGIFGNDEVKIEGEESGYTRGAENVISKSHQYAVGGTLQSLFGQLGLANLTFSQVLNYWDQYVYDDNNVPYYTNISTEIERTLKYDLTLLPHKRLEFDAGVSVKPIHFEHNEWLQADTIFTYNTAVTPNQINGIFTTYPEWKVLKKENSWKFASYVQTKIGLLPRLTLSAGLRYDYFDYIKDNAVDPRLGLSYKLTNATNINLAAAQQSQSPAYVSITSHPNNKNLKYKQTEQVVLGMEHLFQEDTRMTFELFYKDYRRVPIAIAWKTPDPFDRSAGQLVNDGRGFAKGAELFLQKKMSGNYYFTLSYAYSVAKGYDPRYNRYYDWDYDYRHIFTLISGMRFNFHHHAWYQKLSRNIFYQICSLISPLADQTELSVRWRYLGGRPYSQPTYFSQLHYWAVDEIVPINAHRYPPYHRLDVRLDRRYMMRGWNIVTYLDIFNIYGRDNIWEYSYQDDGSIDRILQFQVFPVGGLSIEF